MHDRHVQPTTPAPAPPAGILAGPTIEEQFRSALEREHVARERPEGMAELVERLGRVQVELVVER